MVEAGHGRRSAQLRPRLAGGARRGGRLDSVGRGAAGREVAVLQDVPGPKLRLGPIPGDVVSSRRRPTSRWCPPGTARRERPPARRLAGLRRAGRGGPGRIPGGRRGPPAGARRRGGGGPLQRRGRRHAGLAPGNQPAERHRLAAGRLRRRPCPHRRRGRDGGGLHRALVRAQARGPRARSRAPGRPRDPPDREDREAGGGETRRRSSSTPTGSWSRGATSGIELPIEEVPLVQKRILHLAGRQLKPSITATQMLESMVQSTRPDSGGGG